MRDPRGVVEITRMQRFRDLLLEHEEETETDTRIWDDSVSFVNPFGNRRPRRETQATNPIRNHGVNIEIFNFDGKAKKMNFEDWHNMIKHVFEVRDKLDNLQVKLLDIYVKESLWIDITKYLLSI